MSVKTFEIQGIGPVVFLRRKGSRSFRISISPSGDIRVNMPSYVPYRSAIIFARSKSDWIAIHRPPTVILTNNTPVGKAHHIVFKQGNSLRSSVRANELIIWIPAGNEISDKIVQKKANTASTKLLKIEATQLLPPKLKILATKYGFAYKEVTIKRLRSKWGSCDTNKNIVLNCHLMQLPWHLIEYVMLHELVHTRVMAHGAVFWAELAKYVPDLPAIRKEIKNSKTELVM